MVRRNRPAIIATWAPVKISKAQDNIISCSQFKHLKPFKASYEENNDVHINWLLAGQYGKIWLQEHREWEERNFGAKLEVKENFMQKNIDRIKIMEQKNAEAKKAAEKKAAKSKTKRK